MLSKFLALAAAVVTVTAEQPPDYSGYGFSNVWKETFDGSAGSSPNTNNWNIVQGANNANNEWEVYTNSRSMSILTIVHTISLSLSNNGTV